MSDAKIRIYYTPELPALFKRVGIYCRVSTRSAEQLQSLAAQVSGFVRLVASSNSMRLADVYIDVISGEKPDRPEFMRMLQDAENGSINLILTKSISRFGRNTEDTLNALRALKKMNTQVIFEEEHIDTFKESSELIISIISAYAQADNESRRQNQLWAMKKRLEDGTSEIYSRTCYGYEKNQSGEIAINFDEAKVVQLIFSSYLSGLSIVGIQKILNVKGIKSSRGNDTWSKRAIEKILTNEKYLGNVIAKKTITLPNKNHKRVENLTECKYLIEGLFPAIITRDIFDAVQEERKRRTNIETSDGVVRRKDSHYSSKR